MRKIEQRIINALKAGESFNQGSTSVEQLPRCGETSIMEVKTIGRVYLHGNLIAQYDPHNKILDIADGGWTSNTTKSRLNALLDHFSLGYGISQKAWEWGIVRCGTSVAWEGSARFERGELVS